VSFYNIFAYIPYFFLFFYVTGLSEPLGFIRSTKQQVTHNVTILTDYYITNEKQCTYNVILRCYREAIVVVEKQ
jgi:hypothetical protein